MQSKNADHVFLGHQLKIKLSRQISLFCLLLMFGNLGFSQSYQAYLKAADKAFERQDYYAVLHYCRGALERKPKALDAWYKYARAAQLFYAYEEAVKGYEKVLRLDKTYTYKDIKYQLGLVHKGMGEYEEAIVILQEYQGEANEDQKPVVAQHIMACQSAMKTEEESPRYTIAALSKRLNSPYSDFGPWMQGDTLYYSSYRYENKLDQARPKRKITKLLYAKGNGRGRPVRYINSDTLHTAHAAISLDGQRLYYTQCKYQAEGDIRCALYYRKKDRRNRWGRKAYRLPNPINQEKTTNTQPAIGFDSLLQTEVLYFVSDRAGGKGGYDIWWTKIESGENKFSAPRSFAGNTTEDEITPFIATREQRIYFSGNYAMGLGGYDIYRQALQTSSASQREALPAPINSSYNDIYFFQQEGVERGLFVSNRPGQRYLDPLSKACCNDIYRFEEIPALDTVQTRDSVKQPDLALDPIPIPDPVVDPGTNSAKPIPVPSQLADFLPLALFFENDHPDPRTRKSKTKLDYLSTFEPYLETEETYVDNYLKLFPAKEEDKARSAMQDFFEREVAFGGERLVQFSNLLLERLEEGGKVEIFVKGYTSPRAQSDYNLQLGKRRVSSLINHFKTFQDGVLKPYLANKQLLISERSFGETTAAKSISDDLTDLQRSIYSIDAARERRVEIVEVKQN